MRSQAVERLKECFARLPGIGPKTSERLTYHLLAADEREATELAEAIQQAREATKVCSTCFNLDEMDPCSVCSDEGRNRTLLMVVEHPQEVASFEQAGYQGLYHVLQGKVSSLEEICPEDLTVAALLRRLRGSEVSEVCLATNPDLEGEATARMIHEQLQQLAVKVTRLARGIPAGATIQQVSQSILADAMEGRRPLS
ncbi:MAG: recombination mediator RecR [Planctomycetota bacterium]